MAEVNKTSYRFLMRTAWRDSRKNRGKLLLFMSSIVLGITALVAINSFNYSITRDLDNQAAALQGADLVVSGNREASENILNALDSIKEELAREKELFSMAYLPAQDETQFVRIKALQGQFPFYGQLKTDPSQAAVEFRNNPYALVDDGMMIQQGLKTGDSLRLGTYTFIIRGRLLSAFGGQDMGSGFAPSVYIAMSFLDSTQLVQPGSLVNYSYFLKTKDNFNSNAWKEAHRQLFRTDNMRIETIDDRKEDLREAFGSLNNFLNLVALVSLLLGCIGVASSVYIYLRNKISSIAIFRCLGMRGRDALFIYLFQILVLGSIGAVLGVILGSTIQSVLPVILEDFLPYKVETIFSWRAVLEGLSIGLITTLLFSLLPLLSVLNISPLQAIRVDARSTRIKNKDYRVLLFSIILCFLFLSLWWLTSRALDALWFSLGLAAAFGILFLVTRLVMWGVRKYFPRRWNFVLRQGISNLFRPNNQTQTLLVSIGLGTTILTTLFIIQGLILNNVAQMDAGNQPNMILFGIEPDQKDSLARLTAQYKMPIIQQVPIVTMRIEAWKGRTKAEWVADTTSKARPWAFNREARVTFRDTIDAYEELTQGTFVGRIHNPGDSIFISLDEGFAENLDVGLGDEIVFNVQGTRLTTYVSSLRKIDFTKMRTRFFIVFPLGVLENAPQFQVLVTKSPNAETTANYRRTVVKSFPNISLVDLGMILSTLSDLLKKVSLVVQFMAIFSILTGLIVLISSLMLSKYQRINESIILRTLGAQRRQIFLINLAEYALLGFFSALTGMIIALLASYLLARFQFDLKFTLNWWPIFIILLLVILLTIAIGLFNSREVVSKPPLEVLRKEVD